MNGWERHVRSLRKESRTRAPDWAGLEAAIHQGIAKRTRARRIRTFAAVALVGAVIAAIAVLGAIGPSNDGSPDPVALPTPRDGQKYDQDSRADLIGRCGRLLGEPAGTVTGQSEIQAATSNSGHIAAAVVTDGADQAFLCVGVDAGSGSGYVLPVQAPAAPNPEALGSEGWTYLRVPNSQAVVVATNSEQLDRIAIDANHDSPDQVREQSGSIAVLIFEPAEELAAGTTLEFGLFDSDDCLCGPPLRVTIDDSAPPDAEYMELPQAEPR